jgi:hypothetical protein
MGVQPPRGPTITRFTPTWTDKASGPRGAGRDRDLLATAKVVRRAKELSFAEISIATDEGRPVASGVLVYRIVP